MVKFGLEVFTPTVIDQLYNILTRLDLFGIPRLHSGVDHDRLRVADVIIFGRYLFRKNICRGIEPRPRRPQEYVHRFSDIGIVVDDDDLPLVEIAGLCGSFAEFFVFFVSFAFND